MQILSERPYHKYDELCIYYLCDLGIISIFRGCHTYVAFKEARESTLFAEAHEEGHLLDVEVFAP